MHAARRLLLVVLATVVATGCLQIPPIPSSPLPGSSTRIGLYGDSAAFTLGWPAPDALPNRAVYAGGPQRIGCGIGRGGLRWVGGGVDDFPECNDVFDRWRSHALADRPDVAVVWVGPWDTLLRLIPGDSQWRTLGDPVYDQYLLGEMLVGTDTLLAAGVKEVVWVVPPPMRIPEHSYEVSTQRAYAFRDLVSWVQVLRSGRVTIADQWAWTGPRGEDGLIRPDGVHFSNDGAIYTWRAWLAGAAVAAATS